MEVLKGNSSMNRGFSIAMFDYWRVCPEGMQRFWLMILANIKLFKLHSLLKLIGLQVL